MCLSAPPLSPLVNNNPTKGATKTNTNTGRLDAHLYTLVIVSHLTASPHSQYACHPVK